MSVWRSLDTLDRLFVAWAFLLQVVFIIHFAVRKIFFTTYTLKFGWIVYALCIPAVVISIILLRSGKSWAFWAGGFIFVIYAAFGFWVDYVAQLQFRNPIRLSVLIPYILLYLSTVMFYWWPLIRINRNLWYAYLVLYVIATVLNITSH